MDAADQFSFTWIDGGRPPREKPDPAYPDGRVIKGDVTTRQHCRIDLPYPSPHKNIGQWIINCRRCGMSMLVTAASRPDDMRTIWRPCNDRKSLQ